MISPRAARLLLSQHFWWAHGERSLHVGLPTDTPRARPVGACRASAAKRRPLQGRETTRGARARRSRALAAKRAAIGSAAVGLTNSYRTRPYSRASARSLQERLTSCKDSGGRPYQARRALDPSSNTPSLKQALRKFRSPRALPRGRTRFGSTDYSQRLRPAPPGTSRKVEEIPAAKKSAP